MTPCLRTANAQPGVAAMPRSIPALTLALSALVLSACGGGGGGGAPAAGSGVTGIATPANVSVVTAN